MGIFIGIQVVFYQYKKPLYKGFIRAVFYLDKKAASANAYEGT